MPRRLVLLTAAAILLALTLAACGGSSDAKSSTQTSVPTAADAVAGGMFNDADVSFAQGMIPHHEQAIAMADLALASRAGASAEVVALAKRVKAAQGPEVEMMRGWLTAWGKPMDMSSSGGHSMTSMPGMMSSEDMKALGAASKADFNRMWAEMMIQHHEGAIEAAKAVQKNGSSGDVRKLAGQIVAAQEAEITDLKKLAAE